MSSADILSGKKILVADDEEDLREILVSELELYGAEAVDAKDAAVAKQLLEQESVDAVISDIRMPGGGGVGLLEWLKNDQASSIPVILITGFADISREEALDKGAEAVFSKPIDWDQLIAAVARVMKPVAEVWAQKPEAAAKRQVSVEFASLEDAVKDKKLVFGHRGFFLGLEKNFPNIGDLCEFSIQLGSTSFKSRGLVQWIRREQLGDFPPGVGVELFFVESPSIDEVCKWSESAGKTTIPRA